MELLLSALVIFALRLVDVSLGTMRIVFLVRSKRGLAGVVGFFESLTWVIAAGQVLSGLDEPLKMAAYAGGYAAGTMLGSSIERWLAMGNVLVRIVAPVDSPHAYEALQEAGYPTTVINGEGRDGAVRVAFSVLPRRSARKALDLLAAVNPDAFVTMEDARLPDLATRRSAASIRK
ncbi:MAG: DUF5698 domain-containing protein [Acidimicrobiia bacterium]|nr:DUF5698 domain-containing protein [Acidimicrobiia bacterium]MDH4307816.1 DUF5698 domain-containing protein [Acidimicrobiia bacterium]MDH5292335.1 DUF5698 domain-containing protein [Acidimicrobiia bacterium]